MFKGSIPALVTPFAADGAPDLAALARLVERAIAAGVGGVVPCGTTGEAPTLTEAEQQSVIAATVEAAAGRVPVIAGAGAPGTAHALHLARRAKAAGADAVMVVTPYYNRPSQEGLYQHYRAIHDALDHPLLVYNVPARTGTDISIDTLARLAELPNMAGVKDATPDLARPSRLRALVRDDFCLLSGEDATQLAFLAQGGQGCISVTANVAPADCVALHRAFAAGDMAAASAQARRLAPLHQALFCAPNPAPAKHALARLGLMRPDLRLPLVGLTAAEAAVVDGALAALSLDRAA